MKVKDGICALVAGDALGVPVEFSSRAELAQNPVRKMRGYGTYGMPPGTFSDDSSMVLATMSSIIEKGRIDYGSIMNEFVRWYRQAKYTQYNETFDIGNTTRKALESYMHGEEPLLCGRTGFRDNGNGSLMRILPIAYMTGDYSIIEDVSSLTHGHDISKIACCLYCETAREIMVSDKATIRDAVERACEKISSYYKGSEYLDSFERILDGSIYSQHPDSIKSSGYVVDTLESVIYVLGNTGSLKEALLKAVNLGSDTDTVAAICGGLAGIYYGFCEIPEEWLDEIKGIERIIELCEKFEECL